MGYPSFVKQTHNRATKFTNSLLLQSGYPIIFFQWLETSRSRSHPHPKILFQGMFYFYSCVLVE